MQKDILENFQKMTQLTLENFKKLGETNLRIGEKLLQEQVELTNSLLETATSATEVKDMKDVAAKQAEWTQDWSKQVMESSRNCAEIIAEAGKVYNNMFESCMKSCSDKPAAKARKTA